MKLNSAYSTFQKTDRLVWWQVGILYLFPILSYYGYKYVDFNLAIFKALYFAAVPLMFLYVSKIWLIKHRNNPYFKVMNLITLSTILSILMAYLFWGQNIVLGYRATASLLAIIFYFYLLKTSPSLHRIETFIWVFAVVYIILWLYGISSAPTIVFGDPEDILDSRGVFRLSLPSRASIIVAFFLALNKYELTHKKKYIILFVLFFIFIVLQVTRQIILWSFLIGLYYLLRNNKRVWLYLFCVGLLLVLFANNITISEDSVIGKLLSTTESQINNQKSGEEDIRIREYRFFLSDFSKNTITNIFGNGMPHFNSDYGNYYENTVQNNYKFYMSDVGYAQMFVVTGLVGLLLYLFLFLKVVREKVPSTIMFAKLFIIYQLFANIAASWYAHDVIYICISIYLLSIYRNNRSKTNQLNEIQHYHTNL